MKTALLLVLAVAGCGGCNPPAPAGDPVAPVVYGKLVAGGCLAPSDGGVAAVAAEHASPNPPWMQCLYDGGTVAACGAPCK